MNAIIDELNKRKVPIVKIDNSLREFLDKPVFQDKVNKANETLKKVGLPILNKNEKNPTNWS